MIFPILGLYTLGGLGCGAALSMQYVFYLHRRLRRLPWSISLGLGWLLFVAGLSLAGFAQLIPQKYNSWQNEWGFGSMGIGIGCWWVTLFTWITVRRHQNA